MKINGSDNVDEWSDDGGERMWWWRCMQLTIEVNKTDCDSGFTRSQKFATFPKNVLLRVAYT